MMLINIVIWRSGLEELVFCYPLEKLNFSDAGGQIREYRVSDDDKAILRELGKQKAEIASLPVHREKIALWKAVNTLGETRPMVWINEIPWHEMDVDDELKLTTSTKFAQFLETRLRRTIYQWKHMRADMIVEPVLPCYNKIEDTGFQISEDVEIAMTDEDNDVYSRKFFRQIVDYDDIEKIKMPVVSHDERATEEKYQCMVDIFDGILSVEKTGMPGFWFAPWDELIRWWGVQDAMYDLVDRPDLVHKVMERLTAAYLRGLDQYEEKNLLALNNCNYRIGSGGLGYTDVLPQDDFNGNKTRTEDLWGCGAAQIFSSVSPEMHHEFALQYEIRWMKRFGLNYYGCCEPLDRKIDILSTIPNLRKISMSPWVDLERASANVDRKYVISWKPNPDIFVGGKWNADEVRRDLAASLRKLKNNVVEIIMKDVSSLEYTPQHLWEWARIAVEESERLGG
jgi:hypothetical protein